MVISEHQMIGVLIALCISCAPERTATKQPASSAPSQESSLKRQLAIHPSAATVKRGDTIRLVAAFDVAGLTNERATNVTWKSSNTDIATVSDSGLVTAIAQGLVGIAAHQNGQIAIARIIVSGSSKGTSRQPIDRPTVRRNEAPSDTVSTVVRSRGIEARRTHEPKGFRQITTRAFNTRASKRAADDEAEGWRAEAEFRDRGLSIVNDETAPTSPPRVAQIRYEKGMIGGAGPAGMIVRFSDSPRAVYARTAMKLSADFYGHPTSGVNKLNFFYMADHTTSAYFSAQGRAMGPLTPQLRLQSINGPPSGRNLSPNVRRSAKLSRGVWHVLEFLLIVNTPGLPNGEAHVWMDGDKILDYRDINYLALGESAFDAVSVTSIWGGGNRPRVPHDMYVWWDHVYVSGR